MMQESLRTDYFQCGSCGEYFFCQDGTRCEVCDSLTCPGCIEEKPAPICPDCSALTLPQRIEPMLARHGELPDDSANYGFEFKWDGIRAITYWDGKTIRIESRNLNNITGKYPELTDLGKYLTQKAVVDGEIIALDRAGKPSFHLLQQRMHLSADKARFQKNKLPVYYHIFDILHYGDEDLMGKPYRERREILEGLKLEHPNCRVPASYRGRGEDILEVARKYDLEGILCKQLESTYSPGQRSAQWRKVKFVKSGKFVIGGYRLERNGQRRIGSIQIGAYNQDMELKYLGGIGTGFNAHDHELLLEKLTRLNRSASPFDDTVSGRDIVFVEPRLVASVEYRRWPDGSMIQQGSFKGLRSDISPCEVVIEEKK